jgi:hemoglobin
MINFYEKYGGDDVFEKVIREFYDKVEQNSLISHYFKNIEKKESLIRHQIYFLTQILGGPRRYFGRTLVDAHKYLNITEKEFREAIKILYAVLIKTDVEKEDAMRIIEAIEAMKVQIINH